MTTQGPRGPGTAPPTRYRDGNGRPVLVGARIAGGGEGVVYRCDSHHGQAAKIWADPRTGDEQRKAELIAGTQAPASHKDGRYFIAWPTSVIYDAQGQAAGILMPLLPPGNWKDVIELLHPAMRAKTAEAQKRKQPISQADLAEMALYYVAGVDAIHRAGCILGDINDKNVMVDEANNVAIIDCDSFQVTDPSNGRIYPVPKHRDEFQAPELQGKVARQTPRTVKQDSFALGVLVFKMLCEGEHPFGGKAGDQAIQEQNLSARIKDGWNPLTPENLRDLDPRWDRLWNDLNTPLREMLRACLYSGLEAERRPDPYVLAASGLQPYLRELRNAAAETSRQARPKPVPAGQPHGNVSPVAGQSKTLIFSTDQGHFVTWSEDPRQTIQRHLSDLDPSTRGLRCNIAWQSRSLSSDEARNLETTLYQAQASGDLSRYRTLTRDYGENGRGLSEMSPWGNAQTATPVAPPQPQPQSPVQPQFPTQSSPRWWQTKRAWIVAALGLLAIIGIIRAAGPQLGGLFEQDAPEFAGSAPPAVPASPDGYTTLPSGPGPSDPSAGNATRAPIVPGVVIANTPEPNEGQTQRRQPQPPATSPPTATPTPTLTPTPQPTATPTPPPTATPVPLPTATPYPTATPPPTATPYPTATPLPTPTPTPAPFSLASKCGSFMCPSQASGGRTVTNTFRGEVMAGCVMEPAQTGQTVTNRRTIIFANERNYLGTQQTLMAVQFPRNYAPSVRHGMCYYLELGSRFPDEEFQLCPKDPHGSKCSQNELIFRNLPLYQPRQTADGWAQPQLFSGQ